MFNPINIDKISNDPDKLKEVSEVLKKLSVYTSCKAKCIEALRKGHNRTSLTYQRKAHLVYTTLPKWAKW